MDEEHVAKRGEIVIDNRVFRNDEIVVFGNAPDHTSGPEDILQVVRFGSRGPTGMIRNQPPLHNLFREMDTPFDKIVILNNPRGFADTDPGRLVLVAIKPMHEGGVVSHRPHRACGPGTRAIQRIFETPLITGIRDLSASCNTARNRDTRFIGFHPHFRPCQGLVIHILCPHRGRGNRQPEQRGQQCPSKPPEI